MFIYFAPYFYSLPPPQISVEGGVVVTYTSQPVVFSNFFILFFYIVGDEMFIYFF